MGVANNLSKALLWYLIAELNKAKDMHDDLNRVKNLLSKEEILDVSNQVDKFILAHPGCIRSGAG